MENNILLSICIPTCDQPKEIKRFLESIEQQISPEIEVVIQDDSIDDDTKKIVDKFFSKVPIRYFGRHCYFNQDEDGVEKLKKGEKGGIDRSIIFLTQEARGKYVWWMGDDVLNKGAIKEIVSILKKYPAVTFIWVNHLIANNNNLATDFEKSYFFEDHNDVIEKLTNGLGFISATIFKKEKAINGIENSKKYIGTAFVNLYLVLHVLSEKGKYYYLRGPYLISYLNTPDEVNDNGFQVFGVYFFDIFNEFKYKFNKKSIRRVISNNFSSLWRGMIIRWVTGYESPKGKCWKVFKLYWNFPEFWIAMPLFLMPLWINKILYKIYKIFFSHRKWIFSENLKSYFKKWTS